jgi:hypothetical protein
VEVTRPTKVISPSVRARHIAVEVNSSAADDVGEAVTVRPYEAALCVLVLELIKGRLDARAVDQILVATLIADIVV